MVDYLYHKDIGFPNEYKKLQGNVRLTHSKHSLSAHISDRYGSFTPLSIVNLNRAVIVEVVMNNEKEIIHYLLRDTYDEDFDVCLAVVPQTEFWKVKTAWLNKKIDKHYTLDTSKYNKLCF